MQKEPCNLSTVKGLDIADTVITKIFSKMQENNHGFHHQQQPQCQHHQNPEITDLPKCTMNRRYFI